MSSPESSRVQDDDDNVIWMQATAAQQAEMKKIKDLQDKLGAELTSLSQKMTNLQTSKLNGGAEGQVRYLCCLYVYLVLMLCLLQQSSALLCGRDYYQLGSIDCIHIKYVTSKRCSQVQAQSSLCFLEPPTPSICPVSTEIVCICLLHSV